MPRQARIDAPGAVHHVMVRGIERRKLFGDNQDRNHWIERMVAVLEDIHLNPLRGALVKNLSGLDRYLYSGHSALMGHKARCWQDTDYVLKLFSRQKATARKRYREFVSQGISEGRRPDLVGGGLIRSLDGWQAVKIIWGKGQRIKGDERILLYWAHRELGLSTVELSKRLKLSQPSVSQSTKRGEGLIIDRCYTLF
jgi:hypothetical protein